MIQKMFLAGAKNLEAKKEWINELNVFPVPDGDTGTNMTMTIMAAAREVSALENPDLESLAKAISYGSLRGARGNSGVILSQLFRGFTKEIKNVQQVDAVVLSLACERAVETAYKAVMKPKEGTILTVAKGICESVVEMCKETDDLEQIIQKAIEAGDDTLNRTPEMLPVLKQAGVVDSGGQGLMQVLKGAHQAFLGKELDLTIESGKSNKGMTESVDENITFGYCTEFIVMLEHGYTMQMEQEFKKYLESIGDSIVVVSDEDIIKVHVHTNDPGLAIQKGLTYGSLSNMKIDNMRLEHQEKLIKDAQKIAQEEKQVQASPVEEKKDGFIVVSAGDGMSAIFQGLGVDYIIEGGQTMNPSTEDILNAIAQIPARTIYVFPNNKNIILAANQAKELTTDKSIFVIPTTNIPQGITALINYMPDKTPQENEERMLAEIQNVRSGQVTYAVRDTTISNQEIRQGNIMGLGDNGILTVGEQVIDTTIALVRELVQEETEILSLYYGKEVSEEEAGILSERLEKEFPDVDVELNYGGQPIYYYVVSAE